MIHFCSCAVMKALSDASQLEPQQNGVAERFNRTLLEKIWCLLSNSGLNKSFLAEAMTYASHLINRLPSSAIGGKSLMEI